MKVGPVSALTAWLFLIIASLCRKRGWVVLGNQSVIVLEYVYFENRYSLQRFSYLTQY